MNLCPPRAVRASLLNEVTPEPYYHPNLIITCDVIFLDIVISIIPFIIVVAIFAKNTTMALVNKESTRLVIMTIIQKVIDRGERGGGGTCLILIYVKRVKTVTTIWH